MRRNPDYIRAHVGVISARVKIVEARDINRDRDRGDDDQRADKSSRDADNRTRRLLGWLVWHAASDPVEENQPDGTAEQHREARIDQRARTQMRFEPAYNQEWTNRGCQQRACNRAKEPGGKVGARDIDHGITAVESEYPHKGGGL